MSVLSMNLVAKRIASGLDQTELAERVQVTSSTISRIENGLKVPSVSLLSAIADALDCSTDELLGRSKNQTTC